MTKPERHKARGVFLSVSLLSSAAVIFAVQGMVDGFLSHPVFLVKEVEVRWPESVGGPKPSRFRLRPPTSIFRVDLGTLSRAFQRRYPASEVERIERVLPNRLRATMRLREVVAQLHAGGKYYPVNDEGTVVSPAEAIPRPGLIVLYLDRVRGPFRTGQSLGRASFWKASDLLAAIHRDGGIAGHRVTNVRVRGPDLLLSLESGLEIRFSVDRLWLQWQRLAELVAKKQEVLVEAAYLDLRFEDPVIGDKKKR